MIISNERSAGVSHLAINIHMEVADMNPHRILSTKGSLLKFRILEKRFGPKMASVSLLFSI